MKEYLKPEVQFVELVTEAITDIEGGTGLVDGSIGTVIIPD